MPVNFINPIVALVFIILVGIIVYLGLQARKSFFHDKESTQRIMSAEGFSKAIIDTAVEAIISIDSRGIVESFNIAAEQIFCYAPSEIIGKNVKLLMPQLYAVDHDDYLNHYLNTGEKKIIGIGRDVTGRRKDGRLFPMHLSVSEVFHQSERKFVGMVRDISIQRASENEVSEHRERLAQIDRFNMLDGMATGLAHEINQPLTAISMYAQSCMRFIDTGLPDKEILHEALEKLSKQAHRAGAVIERMQQMVKQGESQRESLDCNDLIRDIHKLAEMEANVRDMVIELKLPSTPLPVVCDPIQIQQVALNLLRNGLEAMKDNTPEAGKQIVIIAEEMDNEVRVSVVDNGHGVSAEIERGLFQPFSSSNKTGMGLGLYISQAIINAHGGRLYFTNNEISGATFCFTIPKEIPDDV